MPLDPDTPNAQESVIRSEPIEPGDRLTTGEPPYQRHWEVVAVEATSFDGQRFSGPMPIGQTELHFARAIVRGRLALRPLS